MVSIMVTSMLMVDFELRRDLLEAAFKEALDVAELVRCTPLRRG